MKKKALIAMSGGVDSSVAALLMQEAGYECRGIMMRLFVPEGEACREKQRQDEADAAEVCRRLGMPFEIVDLEARFREKVINTFVEAYRGGKTPNPCLYCNKYLKFGSLFELARERDCEYLASGHYARVLKNEDSGRFELHQALNPEKDQSYVLYDLKPQELQFIRFPLGGLRKEEVRRLAGGLVPNMEKKGESQDICFIPDGDYASFIDKFSREVSEPGNFVLRDGTVLGRHKGIIHYTVGQRKGLGIAWSEALFVVEIRAGSNEVVLGPASEVFSKELLAEDANYLDGFPPEPGSAVKVRTRYRQKENSALFYPLEDGRFRLCFDKAQRAVTPGQAAVFYEGTKVLGGGTIV